jgi:hypothetical protein
MRTLRALAAVALVLGAAGQVAAEDDGFQVGGSVGYSSRFERPLVSLDLIVSLSHDWALVPNGSYSEVAGVRRWTGGIELQWNAPAEKLQHGLLAWVGAGMGVLTEHRRGPHETTTRDLLADAVVGVGYDLPAAPFIQMRVALDGPSDVRLAVGVRF